MPSELQQRIDQTLHDLKRMQSLKMNRYAAVGLLHGFVMFLAAAHLSPHQQRSCASLPTSTAASQKHFRGLYLLSGAVKSRGAHPSNTGPNGYTAIHLEQPLKRFE